MNVGCELYLEWGFDGNIGFDLSSQLLGDELWPCGIYCFDNVLDNGALVDQACGMAVVNEKEIVEEVSNRMASILLVLGWCLRTPADNSAHWRRRTQNKEIYNLANFVVEYWSDTFYINEARCWQHIDTVGLMLGATAVNGHEGSRESVGSSAGGFIVCRSPCWVFAKASFYHFPKKTATFSRSIFFNMVTAIWHALRLLSLNSCMLMIFFHPLLLVFPIWGLIVDIRVSTRFPHCHSERIYGLVGLM